MQERENMSSIRNSKGNLMTRVMGLIAAAGISKNVAVDNSKFRWPAIQVEAELYCAGRSMRKWSTLPMANNDFFTSVVQTRRSKEEKFLPKG
jgi:hypothetical protein